MKSFATLSELIRRHESGQATNTQHQRTGVRRPHAPLPATRWLACRHCSMVRTRATRRRLKRHASAADRLDRLCHDRSTTDEAPPRDNCLGLRSSHAVAWHKHDIVTLIANRSVLVDGIAGAGPDALASAMQQDVARAVSVLTHA
jgi:hypothetical protein